MELTAAPVHTVVMDKTKEGNMNKPHKISHTVPLTEEQEALVKIYDDAIELAHLSFTNPSDELIEGVYERLLVNYAYGQGVDGAATVH